MIAISVVRSRFTDSCVFAVRPLVDPCEEAGDFGWAKEGDRAGSSAGNSAGTLYPAKWAVLRGGKLGLVRTLLRTIAPLLQS
jgi:hypothetical protein